MYMTCPCQRLVNLVNRLLNVELIVRIRVRPGSRSPRVGGTFAQRLIVAVAQPAVDGQATDAAQLALARALGVKRNDLTLLRGATSRDKDFILANITDYEFARVQAQISQLSA